MHEVGPLAPGDVLAKTLSFCTHFLLNTQSSKWLQL